MRILATMALLALFGCGANGGGGGGSGGGGNGGGGGGNGGNGGSGGSGGSPGGGGFPGTACLPACDGKACGDDGCGGVCGACNADQLCQAAACVAAPAPLIVDATGGPHPIHPAIYGVAFASNATLDALHAPLNRWGGDSSTLYNWQLDVSNHATWWYYENIPNDGGGTGAPGDPGFVSSADKLVADNRDHGAATLMTIPTIGWTPKDRHGAPYTCGFPASRYGAGNVGQLGSSDSPDCGNAKDGAGNIIPSIVPDPTNDSVAVDPAFEADWVRHLVDRFHDAAGGGVQYYQLDNEMMLWPSTHHDVRADPVDSDEVWDKTLRYGVAVKSADPSAYLLGYTAWYALDLFVSGKDSAAGSDADKQAHGNVPLAQWYLRQLKQYEAQNGGRIVDCLDFHYYPQGGDPLENTRSLWDPSYHDPSWFNDFMPEPMRLLPRLLEWILAEYPGTGICLSEYNWNLNDDGNAVAGLVEADVLGLFGKFGLRLAAFWTTPGEPSAPRPAYRAFQLYRNADGQGHGFGDRSVAAASTLAKVALYAAVDSASGALTVMVINKDTAALAQPLTLQNFAAGGAAKVYQVVGGGAPTTPADYAVAGGKISLSVPGRAMQLIVIPKS